MKAYGVVDLRAQLNSMWDQSMTEPHKSLIEGNTCCIIVKQLIVHPVFYMNYCFLSVVERLEEGICCEVGGGDIPTPEQKLWDMQYALDMLMDFMSATLDEEDTWILSPHKKSQGPIWPIHLLAGNTNIISIWEIFSTENGPILSTGGPGMKTKSRICQLTNVNPTCFWILVVEGDSH